MSAFYNAGKLTAADCHGPYCLIEAKKADGTPLVAGLEGKHICSGVTLLWGDIVGMPGRAEALTITRPSPHP